MARIYNPSMLMLDPSLVMSGVRAGRERDEQERGVRKGIVQGIGDIGGSLAGIGARALRQAEIGELPEDADDEWKAVVERFVDTGDTSGISSYKQRKADEAYKKQMAELQKLQAEGAKKASEASLSEGKRKDLEILQRELDDAEYGLTKAITAYRKGQNKEESKDDYDYYRKKLTRIYKDLGRPLDEIRPLKNDGEGQENTGAVIVEESSVEQNADEKKPTEEFSGKEYTQRKNRALSGLNKKYAKDKELNDFIAELVALSNTPFGGEDKELIGALKQARSMKSDETRNREAREARKALADKWKAMDKSDRYSLTRKDPKASKQMQEAYNEFYGGE